MNNKDRFKAFGSAFMAAAAVAADLPAIGRISEIDKQIEELQEERALLVSGLINDEFKKKEEAKPLMEQFFGEQGRIVQCAGRKIGEFHTAHPECKHKYEMHPAHDFRLKD